MVRSSLSPLLAVWLLPACGSLWGLDEVTRGEGEGGGGAGAMTTSGATSTASTTTASEGVGGSAGEGGGSCECGCPSLIPHGDFETEDDVTQFAWDLDCPSVLVPTGTCGAIRLTGGDQYCGHVDIVSPVAAGDQCVVGRVRAKGSSGSWLAVQVAQEVPELTAQGLYANLGTEHTERSFGCRLPPEMTIDRVQVLTNKGGDSDDHVLEIDYVELEVATCAGTEDLCIVE